MRFVALAAVLLVVASVVGCGGGKFGKRPPSPTPEHGARILSTTSVTELARIHGELHPWSAELGRIADFTGSAHRLIEIEQSPTCRVADSAPSSTECPGTAPDTGWQGVAEWRPEALRQGRILLAQRLGRYDAGATDPPTHARFAYGGFIHGASGGSTSLQGWFFVEPVFNVDSGSRRRTALDASLTRAAAYGVASGTNPTTGFARWTGVVVGVHVGGPSDGDLVHGSITLDVGIGGGSIDVSVQDLRNLSDNAVYGTGRLASWTGLALRDGRFSWSSAGVSIDGRFYGRDHTSVGGVFRRDALLAAFGGARAESGDSIPPPPPPPPPPPSPHPGDHLWFDSDQARNLMATATGIAIPEPDLTEFWGGLSGRIEHYGVTRTFALDSMNRVQPSSSSIADASPDSFCIPGELCHLSDLPNGVLFPLHRGTPADSTGRFDFFSYVGVQPFNPDLVRDPVLTHRDISLAQVQGPAGWGYGGWLEHGGFVVERLGTDPSYRMGAYFVGDDPVHPVLDSGPRSFEWTGVMIGVDVHRDATAPARYGSVIQGLASVEVDIPMNGGLGTVDVAFTNIRDLREPRRVLNPARWFDLSLSANGEFRATGNPSHPSMIHGQFFHDDQLPVVDANIDGIVDGSQVVGVFDHRVLSDPGDTSSAPLVHIIGGFGAEPRE